jgi:hypothetical protein
MSELLFVGMDIVEETKSLVNFSTSICTDGMTESELKAYKMGVANALSALAATLDSEDGTFVVNINGMEIQEEFDIADLEHYLYSI